MQLFYVESSLDVSSEMNAPMAMTVVSYLNLNINIEFITSCTLEQLAAVTMAQ